MKLLRKSSERGVVNFGWLKALHSFSFGEYYDPRFMGFSVLRVINEDRVTAGSGFPTHGHKDMEIITYPISGQIEHKDSMGNGSIIHRGEIQYMCAGTGVRHSEFNPSKSEELHLLQIWIEPSKKNCTPRYEQKSFSKSDLEGKLYLLCSGSGELGSIAINQDVKLYASTLSTGQTLGLNLDPSKGYWIQVVSGTMTLNPDTYLEAGDGVGIEQESELKLESIKDCEFLLFDLP